jgi:PEP-CTERM motif
LSVLNSATSLSLGTITGPTTSCLAASPPCDGVINVTGSGTFTQGFAFPSSSLENMLVNFVDDVTVNTNNVWTASILDPLGSVSALHQIDADVVAMSFTTSDETHFVPFDCSDNLCAQTAPPNVPEPGSLALLGSAFAAFAGLAAIRRRRA